MTTPTSTGMATRSQRRRSRTGGTLVVALVVLGALLGGACGGEAMTDQGPGEPASTRVTTTGVTAPPRPMPPAPTPEAPMRLLLVGDGLMWDAAPAMEAAAAAIGPSVVQDQSYWGFALSRPGWRDWRALWPSYVEAFDPTVVAVSFGIHDTEPQLFDDVPIDPGDISWPDWYAGQVHKAMTDLTATGASVYWLALPPVGDPTTNDRIARLNQITRHAVEVNPRGHFVEVAPALVAPDGTAAAADAEGSPLRKGDLLHLCATGAGAVASSFAAAVAADMGVALDPALLSGPWRADPRYDQDGPPGCRVRSAAP